MSWDRNNLATHALPSFLCDSLSSSSAGLNLGRHLGQAGTFPMVAGSGPNTSKRLIGKLFFRNKINSRNLYQFTYFYNDMWHEPKKQGWEFAHSLISLKSNEQL